VVLPNRYDGKEEYRAPVSRLARFRCSSSGKEGQQLQRGQGYDRSGVDEGTAARTGWKAGPAGMGGWRGGWRQGWRWSAARTEVDDGEDTVVSGEDGCSPSLGECSPASLPAAVSRD
jgi:hypothetical protein